MIVIALNTIKEFIRNKIMYVILVISVGLIFFSLILSQLALSEGSKIIIDFTISVIEIFGLISTLFLGSYLLYNEISKNTILLILSKNPSRMHFLVGKFIGFLLLLLLLYLILIFAFLIVLFIHKISFQYSYIIAIFLSYFKIAVTLGFIILFSTFMSPFVSLLSSLGVYMISHSLGFVKFYAMLSGKFPDGSFVNYLLNLIYYIFPNFQDLSMKEYLLSPNLGEYTLLHISLSILVAIFYMVITVGLGVIIFNKREF